MVTREDTKRSKPAPDCYLKALEKMELDSAPCIVIEDSPRGLAAAIAAGLQCIIIRSDLLSA
ncbi:HAD-IA family hydrolase [Noviherbaspirillum album]|uniref:HAD-IA family hydrolase n=1 Tax=Noviherbaspirillum album TaxID=3080276 RepID=UPI0034609A93